MDKEKRDALSDMVKRNPGWKILDKFIQKEIETAVNNLVIGSDKDSEHRGSIAAYKKILSHVNKSLKEIK